MVNNFTHAHIIASGSQAKKAATLLADEIRIRIGELPEISESITQDNYILLSIKDESSSDAFCLSHENGAVVITAHRLRGLIYGYSCFLRKAEVKNKEIYLKNNITCSKAPSMKIRGHQLSYTDMNNTYEAWDFKTFRRYILDLMAFGVNMIEGTAAVADEKKNRLMKYDLDEAMDGESAICKELDLDFSVWHPLTTKLTDEETVENVREIYKNTPKLDVLFTPGGDPGDLKCEDFISRSIKMKNELKKKFPDIQLWPSAQAPHEYPDWGEKFKAEMAKLPEEIDGVIYGPNHAMPLDEMRRSLNIKYPIRFYPDVAHNVRCEIPVHFDRNDWHYAFASTLSREAVNPRPNEYRLLHMMTRQYLCGSVSYSEGVNDDVNKMIFSDMDFDFDCDIRESIRDYARLFLWQADTEKMTDALFGLEQNWEGDPAVNSSIDNTYNAFCDIMMNSPQLMNNWRFVLHLFRAECDKAVRDRRIYELNLIEKARIMTSLGKTEEAATILSSEFPDEYILLRNDLNLLAESLSKLIGIQLDVKNFGGMSWERGCTLDTIDNPVTDRRYLLAKFNENHTAEYLNDLFNRNKVDSDEYYFSFAEHGFAVCGKQEGEFYMDFEGDSNFDASIPMCMTNVYDHFNFKTEVAGLTGGDYILRVTYKSRPNKNIIHHKVSVNGNVIHDGEQYGGYRDTAYEKKFLADGFVSVVYDIKKDYIINGCAELEITEPLDGFMISEFRFTKA